MATGSPSSLNAAFSAVSTALARLEAAAETAAHRQAQSTHAREEMQAGLTAGWQAELAQAEAAMAELQSENDFLKEDNLRLSNRLQQLQRDFLDLQNAAGSALTRLDGSVKQLDLLLEH